MDFVARLCKLLMYCAGPTVEAETAVVDVECMKKDDGLNQQLVISEETSDILRFLSFVAPYYNPSNTGGWAFPLGAFVYYLAYELGARLGITAGWKILQRDYMSVARQLVEEEPYLKCIELPGNEIVAFLDRLLPLCQQVSCLVIDLILYLCDHICFLHSSQHPFLGTLLKNPHGQPCRRNGPTLPCPNRSCTRLSPTHRVFPSCTGHIIG